MNERDRPGDLVGGAMRTGCHVLHAVWCAAAATTVVKTRQTAREYPEAKTRHELYDIMQA